MELVGLLGWWYTAGWKQVVARRVDGIAATADYFSISLLAATLFSPFRQISAGKVKGPIVVQFRASIDRLVSRCIGAVVRLVVMGIGIISMVVQAIFSAVIIVLWALVPLLPFIGAIGAFIGWVPK